MKYEQGTNEMDNKTNVTLKLKYKFTIRGRIFETHYLIVYVCRKSYFT